jgi:hypothetical protein
MAAISSKLDQLAGLRRLYGARTAVRWIGYRTVQRVVGLNVAHVVWLDGANLDGSLRADPAYTFRFLSAREVRTLAQNPQNWLNPLWAGRIAAGSDCCFAAWAGPRLAAFTWYALGGLVAEHCAGTPLAYPPGVAYMYHGFTRPELRGKRLHGMVMGLGLRALGNSGVSRLVATIDGANRASLRSCFRLGFVSLGRAVVFTCGRFRAGFYPRAAKRLGIRFGKNALTAPWKNGGYGFDRRCGFGL